MLISLSTINHDKIHLLGQKRGLENKYKDAHVNLVMLTTFLQENNTIVLQRTKFQPWYLTQLCPLLDWRERGKYVDIILGIRQAYFNNNAHISNVHDLIQVTNGISAIVWWLLRAESVTMTFQYFSRDSSLQHIDIVICHQSLNKVLFHAVTEGEYVTGHQRVETLYIANTRGRYFSFDWYGVAFLTSTSRTSVYSVHVYFLSTGELHNKWNGNMFVTDEQKIEMVPGCLQNDQATKQSCKQSGQKAIKCENDIAP